MSSRWVRPRGSTLPVSSGSTLRLPPRSHCQCHLRSRRPGPGISLPLHQRSSGAASREPPCAEPHGPRRFRYRAMRYAQNAMMRNHGSTIHQSESLRPLSQLPIGSNMKSSTSATPIIAPGTKPGFLFMAAPSWSPCAARRSASHMAPADRDDFEAHPRRAPYPYAAPRADAMTESLCTRHLPRRKRRRGYPTPAYYAGGVTTTSHSAVEITPGQPRHRAWATPTSPSDARSTQRGESARLGQSRRRARHIAPGHTPTSRRATLNRGAVRAPGCTLGRWTVPGCAGHRPHPPNRSVHAPR
jgi:hypothetical protein